MPVLGKGLDEGVCGFVVALAWLVNHCDYRACQPEKVQRVVQEGLVKIPSTVNLWPIRGDPVRLFHVDEWRILDLISGMIEILTRVHLPFEALQAGKLL